MYGPSRTVSGVADVDALSSSLKGLPVEAAFTQVTNYLRLHREQAKDFFRICFPVLLQRIFGFEDHPTGGPVAAPAPSAGGWLQQASIAGKEGEARALLTCLDPGAALFQSLLAVDRATSVRFVFPPARLPDWVRRLLASSQGAQLLAEQAPLFQGAIMQDAAGRFQVHLGLCQYFFFWYAYYVVCKDTATSRNTRQAQAQAAQGHFPARRLDPWPSLKLPGLPSPSAAPAAPYRDLLRRYLRHFLPYSAPAMLAPPPPASPLRQLSRLPSGTPEARTPQAASERAAPLSPGDILLHTLLTFWLRDGDPAPFSAADQRFLPAPYGGPAPFSYPPAGSDLLDCLLILVSYIDANPQLAALQAHPPPGPRGAARPTFERAFSGSFRSPLPGGPQPGFVAPPLPPASAALQRPLYRLILRALLTWPVQNGGLAKIEKLVDVWARHLQPWAAAAQQQQPPRHAGFHLQRAQSGEGGQAGQAPAPGYGVKWQGYVLASYAFYNPLVVHLLEWACRAGQADAAATARIVSKVVGALQSPPLVELLRKVEAAYAGHVAARHAPGQQADLCSSLEEQMRDWESGLVQPAPLLGGITPASAAPRLRLFAAKDDGGPRLLQGLVHRVQSEAPRGGAPAGSVKELAALASALLSAAGQEARGASPGGAGAQPQQRRDAPAGSAPAAGSEQSGGPSGRRRPPVGLQRHSWADAHYKGDWMRRPLESGEIGWLVRGLVRASDALNEALQLGPQAEARLGQATRGEAREGSTETRKAPEGDGDRGRGPGRAGESERGDGGGGQSGEGGEGRTAREGGADAGQAAQRTGGAEQTGDERRGYSDAVPLPVIAYQTWQEVRGWAAKVGRSAAGRAHRAALKRQWRVNLRPLGEVQSLVVLTLLLGLAWLLRQLVRAVSG
ncbi:hypothetical protein KFL_005400050 [Klebsormidium nitens]|uniref:Sphingomyelin phosphodiesterase 4 n=1 Tax=Klebsormidium nitens TaxID=105231 RepID=A0A1Y1IFD2_KLENI|nr:hypothetical protein KFL_005400050 [Klebsormidium nitens]|eukprot:GAQ89595.1 hypothetical protein KFL_005400050 [Klebsormidium nitens]